MAASVTRVSRSRLLVYGGLKHVRITQKEILITQCRFFSTENDNEEEAGFKSESKPITKLKGFKKFEHRKKNSDFRKWIVRKDKSENVETRASTMEVNQDWTNVWPTAETVNWGRLPFPVRQGFIRNKSEGKDGLPPKAFLNLELMKIPNFLHLTPAHIAKHCAVLKQYCTPWPKELKSEKADQFFPLEVYTSDYCFSGPSIRDSRARVVALEFPLDKLKLGKRAREKLIKLVGNRYDKTTGRVRIVTDRCPTKQQNYDYSMYVLTVLYHEAQKLEQWEEEITPADRIEYHWELNQPKTNVFNLLNEVKKADETTKDKPDAKHMPYLPAELSEDMLLSLEPVKAHKDAVEHLMNDSESQETLSEYKEAVKKLINIQ